MPNSTNNSDVKPYYVPNVALKAKYALYSALIFFVVANPETYRVTQAVLGPFLHIANDACPTPFGFFFHTFLFFILIWGLMLFPRDS